jgi:arylsulfatase A
LLKSNQNKALTNCILMRLTLFKPVVFFFSVSLFFTACSLNSGSEDLERPNIIVFLADDLGYGDLGCYGNPIIKTPAIDKFASEGVMLTDRHSGGTVCSPSRASLLTGRNPYRSGFYYIQGAWGSHLQDYEITVAELLKSGGYETSFFGKWHLSRLNKSKHDEPGPAEQGFDYWFGTTHNAFKGPKNCSQFIKNGIPDQKVDGWYCDVIVEEASHWLRKVRDKEKPFFIYLSSHEPHTPVAPPEKYSSMYDNEEVNNLEKTIRYGDVTRPDKDINKNKKEYYGTITQLDNAFSNLLKVIDEEGLSDNTIIVFTSDNGPEHPVNLEESKGEWDDPIREYCFGTPGELRGMKRYPYEGGHRVPGIVRWPGKIPAGTVSDKLINATDLTPTFCNIAGVNMPSDRPIDGTDAFQAFLGNDVDREKPCLWIFPTHEDTYFRMPHMAMRHGDYTLVGWFPEKEKNNNLIDWMKSSIPEKFELYNTRTDPGQKRDIASEEAQKLDELIPEMVELWIEIRDEGPDWGKTNGKI